MQLNFTARSLYAAPKRSIHHYAVTFGSICVVTGWVDSCPRTFSHKSSSRRVDSSSTAWVTSFNNIRWWWWWANIQASTHSWFSHVCFVSRVPYTVRPAFHSRWSGVRCRLFYPQNSRPYHIIYLGEYLIIVVINRWIHKSPSIHSQYEDQCQEQADRPGLPRSIGRIKKDQLHNPTNQWWMNQLTM